MVRIDSSQIRTGGLIVGLAAVALGIVAGCPLPTPPTPSGPLLTLTEVATGLGSPVALVAPTDGTGRLLIVEQRGLIRMVDSAGQLLATPFLDLQDRVQSSSSPAEERGLLGLALHPSYAVNGRFFVFFNTAPSNDAPTGSATEVRLSEFRLLAGDGNRGDPASERILLRIAKPQNNHNGGQLAFGPDGYLYVGLGDGGGAGDVGFGHTPDLGNAQDTSNLFGSILRLNVDSGNPYAIPPDNPFVASATARGEIYAYGLRNPWRFSFDVTASGTRLFVADVGQNLMEEVNLVRAGGNYGWNRKEGTLCFDPANPNSPPEICLDNAPDGALLEAPILAYRHTDALGRAFGAAVVGGYLYRGTALPGLRGRYVFGDYTSGLTGPNGKVFIASEAVDGTWSFVEARIADRTNARLGAAVLAFGRDAHGELYILTRGAQGPTGTTGAVHRIVGFE